MDAVKDHAIYMLDPTGHVVTWNSGAQQINRYSASEAIGRHISLFYPPEEVESGKVEQVLRLAAAEGWLEDEGWRVRKDGSRFWANIVITAFRGDAGEFVGFAEVTRNLTKQRSRDLALRQAEEQMHRSSTTSSTGSSPSMSGG